jgi:hypothetical protein
MERRAFVAGALAAVVAPPVARAQNAPRLAMLLTGSPSGPSPEHDAFMAQLATLFSLSCSVAPPATSTTS